MVEIAAFSRYNNVISLCNLLELGAQTVGQVVVVTSGKGGTGKTTLCAAIASCLAAEGSQALCIDADVGLRNLDLSLGMADCAVISFEDVMAGLSPLSDAATSHSISGLSLLTAPLNTAPEALDPAAFGALIDQARMQYDWCLIDAPAGIGAGFRLASQFADLAIVVSTADPASLRDASRTADLLEQLGVAESKLVVNRVTPKLYRQMSTTIDDIMDVVGLPLLGIVPDDYHVPLASSAGVPLVLHTNQGAAEACLHLARRLCGKKAPLLRLK